MNILTRKTEISDGRRFACFKVSQRTDYSTSYMLTATIKTETEEEEEKNEEEKAHRSRSMCPLFVHPPRSSYDILLRTTFSVVVDRSMFLFSLCSAHFSPSRRHVLFHGQSTTFICHVRVCLVSYVPSFCV